MSAFNHNVILLLYFFLVNYVVVEGSRRSLKFDSSTLPDGNTIDDFESVKTGIAVKVALSVTSRLISSPPAEFSDGDSSSGGSNVPVIVICAVLLAVLVTGLVWFIYRNRGNDEDVVQFNPQASSVANHVPPAPPAPVASVNNGGSATVINRHPVAVPMTDLRLKDGRKPNIVNEIRVISSNKLARRDNAAAAARVSDPGTSNPRPSRDAEFRLISSIELTRRDNAAAAARASTPGTSDPRPSGGAIRDNAVVAANVSAPGTSEPRPSRNARRDNAAVAANVSAPGTSEPRPSRNAIRENAAAAANASAPGTSVPKPSRNARRENAAPTANVYAPGTSEPRPSRDTEFGLIPFSHEDLKLATSNFSNKVGEGGFATVFIGFLSDGTKLAVKRLKRENTTGDKEFRNEVKAISKAKHKNIVPLIGYCIAGSLRYIVFEYVENKTLHDHLREGAKGTKIMAWPIRMKIARDTADGIVYLHEYCLPRIIHRDIKPANILLSHDFVAKVADFGVAKLCPESFNTYMVASCLAGTHGYIDPTYWETGVLTFKSDVYSFGVVLLQLVSGVSKLEPLYELRTVELPRALESRNFCDIADPKLKSNYVREEMTLLLKCAKACLRKDPQYRPSMKQVSHVLVGLKSVDEL